MPPTEMTPERQLLAELKALYADTTEGEWAFKSVGEKCYATILGASPYYLSGPKARARKEVDPPISSRGEVSDEYDEKKNDFNEVDFTDRIADSDEQRGGIDFGFIASVHNAFPALAAELERSWASEAALREELARVREERRRVRLGVIEFHSESLNPGLTQRFFDVVGDLRASGSIVDLWLLDIAKVLAEFGYSMEIYSTAEPGRSEVQADAARERG